MKAEPVSRPSLRRRVDHRVAAGVMGGVADAVNAPAGLLRVLILFASTFSQWVSIGYLVLALVIPARGRNRPGWDNLVGLGRFGALFLGVWVWLSPSTDIEAEQWLWISGVALGVSGLSVVLARTYPRGPSPDEARSTVLGTLPLIAFGALIAAGVALFPDFRWERLIPLGAVLMGLALLLEARRARWRPLVAPCVAAVVLTAIAVGSGLRLDGGFGDKRVMASGATPPSQRVAVGELRIVVPPTAPVSSTVRASVGIGTLRVVVPRRARVTVDARVGRGGYEVVGQRHNSGFGIHVKLSKVYSVPGRQPKRPDPTVVHVIADVGVGNLDIHRAGRGDAWF